MRIHYVQHVPFETPGVIVDWALEMNYPLSGTRLYDGEVLPDAGAFDFLVIMGGPMGVRDEHAHPWLAGEKRFIEQTIRAGKKVLGICLGAQLIAEVLGARVYRNTHREIGWFPVRLTARGAASPVFGVLPGGFDAFHWHGDTFTLPAGCVHAAESEACENQAFEFDGRIFGLQFHLEATPDGIQNLLEHCSEDMRPGVFVQSPFDIVSGFSHLPALEIMMRNLLERIQDIGG